MKKILIFSALILVYAQSFLVKGAIAQVSVVEIGGKKANISASSTLAAKQPGRYALANAFDGDLSTAWVEGQEDAGEGASISVGFTEEVVIKGIYLRPGYLKSEATFTENAIPLMLKIHFDNDEALEEPLYYHNEMQWDEATDEPEDCQHTGAAINFAPRIILLKEPVATRRLTITVVHAWPGSKYKDLAISELDFWLEDGELQDRSIDFPKVLGKMASLNQEMTSKDLPDVKCQDLLDRAWLEEKGVGFWNQPFHAEVAARMSVGKNPSESDPVNVFLHFALPYIQGRSNLFMEKGGQLYVVGSQAFRIGDGEWIEFYPALVFDAQSLALKEMKLLDYGDGAPGCIDVLPDLE